MAGCATHRLVLVFADSRLGTLALATRATAKDEGNCDAVSSCKGSHAGANRRNHAADLVPWDERQAVILDITIVATPAVPVAAADARCTDFDDHAPLRRNRNRHVLDPYRPAELVIHAVRSRP